MIDWRPDFLQASPLFAPLRVHGMDAATADWPTLAQLQHMVDARCVVSGGGAALRLTPQGRRAATFEEHYEVRLHRVGELQMRERNWHDLFNVLSWLAFPRAKAALNARHHAAAVLQRATHTDASTANRSPAQDALTLFDEGGMIVASAREQLLRDLRAFEWKRLFVERRACVMRHMCWVVFGHALYEKALQPYVGVTGRAVLLTVHDGFPQLPIAQQLDELDRRTATLIADSQALSTTRGLTPVPVLGVPGVWPDNEDARFYDNASYFRARREAR